MKSSTGFSTTELRNLLAKEQQKCIVAIDDSFTKPDRLHDLEMEDVDSMVDFDGFTVQDTQEAAMDVGWGSSNS